MHRLLILLVLLCGAVVSAQEAEEVETDGAETSEAADTESDDLADVLEGDDELYPVEDEDVFIPSEDVAFGQSIPFPTDI